MVIAISHVATLENSKGHIYVVKYHGKQIIVTVTAKPSVARRWISLTRHRHRAVLSRLVVGLGVQWTPAGGRHGPANLLQLCVGHRCLLFQLTQTDYVPINLRRFLRNPRNTFVGFWNHQDRKKLEESKHKLEMAMDPLDLRKYVKTKGGERQLKASVVEIVGEFLGFRGEVNMIIRKEVSMSDWDDEILSAEQVLHAAFDAFYAFQIGKKLRAWKITRSA